MKIASNLYIVMEFNGTAPLHNLVFESQDEAWLYIKEVQVDKPLSVFQLTSGIKAIIENVKYEINRSLQH